MKLGALYGRSYWINSQLIKFSYLRYYIFCLDALFYLSQVILSWKVLYTVEQKIFGRHKLCKCSSCNSHHRYTKTECKKNTGNHTVFFSIYFQWCIGLRLQNTSIIRILSHDNVVCYQYSKSCNWHEFRVCQHDFMSITQFPVRLGWILAFVTVVLALFRSLTNSPPMYFWAVSSLFLRSCVPHHGRFCIESDCLEGWTGFFNTDSYIKQVPLL